MSDPAVPPLVLTMGEPAGIGGEIALAAWTRRQEGIPVFALLDDPDRLATLARSIELDVPVKVISSPKEAEACWPVALPVLALTLAATVTPGLPDPRNGPVVIDSIKQAVALVQSGAASAVVTNPIHKHVLKTTGFVYPGHTEYLAALAGPDIMPVMMLSCSTLRVVPITIHMSLADALRTLNADLILKTARITAASLQRDFSLARPRLAFAGLNPHAGECGNFGREEIEFIAPAIAQLRAEGLDVIGPLPADTMFHEDARARYDVALCMYHDQALIPIKTLDFHRGVNVTLGLPFIRTSPDHGTAFCLAGTGTANPASLIAALTLAYKMAHVPSHGVTT